MNKDNEEFYGLSNDLCFKRFCGTQDYVFLTTMLIESLFNLPRHSLDGSIIINSIKLDKETIKEKGFELDVKLETPNKDIYCLEMQPTYNTNAEIKNTMYVSKVYGSQLKSGDVYKNAKPTKLINFVKNLYLHDNEDIINEYVITNKKYKEDYIQENMLSIYIVDIDSKNSKLYNEDSNGFKLMRDLLSAETLEETELAIKNLNEPLLKNLLKDMVMFMELDYVQDYRAQEKLIRSNLKDAKDEGIAEGLAEGKNEEKLEIARVMLSNNEPLDKIVTYTNLSLEELKSLKEEIN